MPEYVNPPKLSIRQAIKSIAIELSNANRLRLAELEIRRAELHLLQRVTEQIAASAQAGQAAAQIPAQIEPLLGALLQRLVTPARPAEAARVRTEPAPAPTVSREVNGTRVEAEAPQK